MKRKRHRRGPTKAEMKRLMGKPVKTQHLTVARAGEPPAADHLKALRASVAAHLDLHFDIYEGSDGLAFCWGGRKLAWLWEKEAAAVGGSHERIYADFLEPGDHWDALRGLLLMLAPAGDAARTLGEASATVAAMPDSWTTAVRSAASLASQRIRTGRMRAFDRVVVLEAPLYQIRFDPVRPVADTPAVAFCLRRPSAEPVNASLLLVAPGDLLPVVFRHDADETEVLRGWPIALAAFADLTCIEDAVDKPARDAPAHPGTTRPRAPQADPLRASRSHLPRRRRVSSRPKGLSPSLIPVGVTTQAAASYVSGHRRKLRPDQEHGDGALAIAGALGIRLHPGETWVQPHTRKAPSDYVLRFRWQGPSSPGGLAEAA
jgi:hypothetical protein